MRYFEEHPKYYEKYKNAEVSFPPEITNCWFDLPEELEAEFRALADTVPAEYTMAEFWQVAQAYKQYVTMPPTRYLLNFLSQPWKVDQNGDKHYTAYVLEKL